MKNLKYKIYEVGFLKENPIIECDIVEFNEITGHTIFRSIALGSALSIKDMPIVAIIPPTATIVRIY